MLDLTGLKRFQEQGTSALMDGHSIIQIVIQMLISEVRALRADVLAKDQILNHPCRHCGEEL